MPSCPRCQRRFAQRINEHTQCGGCGWKPGKKHLTRRPFHCRKGVQNGSGWFVPGDLSSAEIERRLEVLDAHKRHQGRWREP